MSEYFKKGFGLITGMYAALLTINIIDSVMHKPKTEVTEEQVETE